MTSNLSIRFWMFLILVMVVSGHFTTQAWGQDRKKAPPAVPVQVALVQKKMIQDQIAIIGTTEPLRESVVASEVSGLVQTFLVKAGDFVSQGTPLAVLGSKGLRLRLKGTLAAHAATQSRLVLAEKELQRVDSLARTNSVSAKQYDEAFHNHSVLKNELLMHKADIDQLEYEISQKVVVAPFSGHIAAEHSQVGQWIHAGGPVVTLVDMSRVLIKVDVPETYAVNIHADSIARVTIDSLNKKPITASVYAMLPKGDPNARTFPIHIRVPNAGKQIKSGMAATVSFSVGAKRSLTLLPKDAIVTAGSQRLVYVVDKEKVAPVSIDVVGYHNNDAAIKGDLRPGQQVVIRGNERLRPGQSVKVVD